MAKVDPTFLEAVRAGLRSVHSDINLVEAAELAGLVDAGAGYQVQHKALGPIIDEGTPVQLAQLLAVMPYDDMERPITGRWVRWDGPEVRAHFDRLVAASSALGDFEREKLGPKKAAPKRAPTKKATARKSAARS